MGLNASIRQEMVNFKQPADFNDAINRVLPNLKHFQVNYFYLAILVTSLYVAVANAFALIGMAFLAGIVVFLNVWTEPLKVGDNFLTTAIIARVFILLYIIIHASFAGLHFLIALLVAVLTIKIHALLHDVETTRSFSQLSSAADAAGSDLLSILNRGYNLFLLAIGADESTEVYNMSSVPRFVAKELKQDLKDVKASVKDLFK